MNPTNQLTYTENGRTYGVVCAWHVEMGKQVPAVQLVPTSKGTYPACHNHAQEAQR